MKTYSHILWDFNGTILNDTQICVDCINIILKRNNIPEIDINFYKENFCFPTIDFYKKLGYDFVADNFKQAALEWVSEYKKLSKNAAVSDGISDVLEIFKNKGFAQIILSASEKSMLLEQLTKLGIAHYFDDVLGLDNIYAASKTDIAIKWVREVNPQKLLMIGDTIHDFEVAEKIGADCLLVACGYQSKAKLELCNVPVFDDILKLKESLS